MSYQIVINYDESIVTTIEIEPNTGSIHKRFYDFNVQDSKLWEMYFIHTYTINLKDES